MWIFSLASLLTGGSVQEEEEEEEDEAPLWTEEEDTACTPEAEIWLNVSLKKNSLNCILITVSL